MTHRLLMISCCALLLACSGTSRDDSAAPLGAELARSDLPQDEHPTLAAADAETFGAGNDRFAFELYAELTRAQEPGENLFVSPYSVSTALAMTYAGAEGTTESEMRDTLHFDLDEPALHSAFNATTRALEGRADELEGEQGTGFELSIVNQTWAQKNYAFADTYLDVLAQQYGAGVFLVDFRNAELTRMLINGWVADQTKDRIQDLLPIGAIAPSLTRLVLTNAVYFKADWLSKFEPKETKDGSFMTDDGARTVSMMHKSVGAYYSETDTYQAVALPYLSPDVRMLLIRPSSDLDSLIESLDGAAFGSLRTQLSRTVVDLTLPKFSFESEYELSLALKALGMPAAFGETADFSGINGGGAGSLHIAAVYHDTFVAVDEKGTEAAAATAVVVNSRSSPPRSTVAVSFDRPFIFLIYDEPTGQILFIGHLRDPR